MPEEEVPIFSSAYPGLRNKLTLSNFISNSYVHHLQFMKALLPEAFRHLYLASGRAEAVDKAVKLFMAKRPEATDVLSYDGDYFGATTATARSLGRQDDTSYFDWPLLAMPDFEALKDLSEKDWQERIEESFRELRMDQILGLMVEPLCEKACIRKPKNYLKALIKVCRSKKLPVIFHESASAFFNYSANRFFCAGDEIKPDGIVFYLGEQVAFLACQEELFLKKPLTMISTWDGDDHSMRLLRDKIFKAFEEKDL
jgi:adenosylmethionine-8-amino-7-oxononanoate aminotransferase